MVNLLPVIPLSWITILKKREHFRQAFSNFDAEKIARYDQYQIDLLLKNAGIIRNKLKIQSAIQNAKIYLDVKKEWPSFSKYIWSFVDGKSIMNNWTHPKEVPAKTDISDTMSKDLKKRGFKFF